MSAETHEIFSNALQNVIILKDTLLLVIQYFKMNEKN